MGIYGMTEAHSPAGRQRASAKQSCAAHGGPGLSRVTGKTGGRTVTVVQHAVVQVALAVAHVVAAARRLCTGHSQVNLTEVC